MSDPNEMYRKIESVFFSAMSQRGESSTSRVNSSSSSPALYPGFEDCFHLPKDQRMERVSLVPINNLNLDSTLVSEIIKEEEEREIETSEEIEEKNEMRQTNPFLIANVLELIFPYLDHSTLKSCRQVCTLWNTMAQPLVNSLSITTLPRGLWDEKGHLYLSHLSQESLENNNYSIPTSNLSYNFNSDFPLPPFPIFFSYGHLIRSLTLQPFLMNDVGVPIGLGDSGGPFFNEFLFFLSRSKELCPNLEHMSLTHLDQINYNHLGTLEFNPFPHPQVKHLTLSFKPRNWIRFYFREFFFCLGFLKILLKMFPNLETLDIDFFSPFGGFVVGRNLSLQREMVADLMKMVKDSGVTKTLRVFKFQGEALNLPSLKVLGEIGFPQLRTLHIALGFNKGIEEEELFLKFLQGVGGTLEELVILRGRHTEFSHARRYARQVRGEKKILTFPVMKKLKYFRNEHFDSFPLPKGFLKSMEGLQELVIEDRFPSLGDISLCPEFTSYGNLLQSLEPHPNLQRLRIQATFLPKWNTLPWMQKIVSSFPNLKELDVLISLAFENVRVEDVLRILVEEGKNLEVLKVAFCQCGELKSLRGGCALEKALSGNIGRFKKLRRLELSLEDVGPMARFNLTEGLLQTILSAGTLSTLYLTGFSIGGINPDKIEACRKILDKSLMYWKISEPKPLCAAAMFY